MNRSDAPAEVKPLLDILDHYYGAGPHACKCKHLVDKESIDTIVTTLRDCYGIFLPAGTFDLAEGLESRI